MAVDGAADVSSTHLLRDVNLGTPNARELPMDEKLLEMCRKASEFDLDRVAQHFAAENDEDIEMVRSWIPELKKWLVMAAYRSDSNLVIFGAIDRLWHHFILFTQEYSEFCNAVAGDYIHHVPAEKIFEVEKKLGSRPETATLETSHSVKEIRADQVEKYRATLESYKSIFGSTTIDLSDPRLSGLGSLGLSIIPGHPGYDPDLDPLVNIWARIMPNGAVACPTTSCCGAGVACGCIQTRP